MSNPPFLGIKTVDLTINDILPLIDKTFLFQRLWHLPKAESESENSNYDLIYLQTTNLAKKENLIIPKISYGYFECKRNGNGIIVENGNQSTRFDFTRDVTPPHFCLANMFDNFITMAIVTVGGNTTKTATNLYKENRYAQVLYIKGFAAACAEATLEYAHNHIVDELKAKKEDSKRFSLGYKACPNLMDQDKFMRLLKGKDIGIVLSETFQLIPEYSASAFITI